MVRKRLISGCCTSSVLMNPIRPPVSIDGKTAAPELAAHTLGQCGIRRFGVHQLVVEVELVPLVAAHLVEAQDLDALERLESGTDVGDLLDVVVPVGETGHEDEAD